MVFESYGKNCISYKKSWHILKTQNLAVDQMVKCVLDNSLGLTIFDDPPNSVREILQLDRDIFNNVV